MSHPKRSVRSIFTGYLGWFSGDAVDLNPLPPKDKARNLIGMCLCVSPPKRVRFPYSSELGGGVGEVLKKARDSLNKGNHQWALGKRLFLLRRFC